MPLFFIFISRLVLLYLWALHLFFSSRVLQTMWSPGQRKSTYTAHLVQLSKWQALTTPLKTPVSSPCKPRHHHSVNQPALNRLFILKWRCLTALMITLLFSPQRFAIWNTMMGTSILSIPWGIKQVICFIPRTSSPWPCSKPHLKWLVLYWP